MECERFIKLIKTWYIQVQDEAMAPARMVDFMRQHLASCPICKKDPVVEAEVKKIIEVVMPPVKSNKVAKEEGETEYDEDDDAGGQGNEEKDEEDLGDDELQDEELDGLDEDDDDI